MSKSGEQVELELRVEGMSCQHCVAAVTKAVESVPGVEGANVDLASGMVSVTGRAGAVDRQQLVEAIRAAGYQTS
jgi:copper chaperone CopZ